jgi:Xaa-Pro aminopeptidase
MLSHVCHRTGHAIDTRLHGIGVNLDTVEFPDSRPLLDGSCFSIEPGVYREQYGMRSEINAYVQGDELVISGGAPQRAVLMP